MDNKRLAISSPIDTGAREVFREERLQLRLQQSRHEHLLATYTKAGGSDLPAARLLIAEAIELNRQVGYRWSWDQEIRREHTASVKASPRWTWPDPADAARRRGPEESLAQPEAAAGLRELGGRNEPTSKMADGLLAEDEDRHAEERAEAGITEAEAETHREAFDAAVRGGL